MNEIYSKMTTLMNGNKTEKYCEGKNVINEEKK